METALRPMGRVGLVVEVVVQYVRVQWLLRTRPLPAVVATLRAKPARAVPASDRRLVRATLRVLAVLPTDTRCLVRALVVLALLSRRGREAQLVVGVLRDDGFQAHAWLERDGGALLPSGRFEPLTRL